MVALNQRNLSDILPPCHRFRANEARLQLSLLAYNLGNLVAPPGAAEEKSTPGH
jgi:hypothetical protein